MTTYIFNTSFYVDDQHYEKWNSWVSEKICPTANQVISHNAEVFEVISTHPGENKVYSVQWRCKGLAEVQKIDETVADILKEFTNHFGEKIPHFSSVMKKI